MATKEPAEKPKAVKARAQKAASPKKAAGPARTTRKGAMAPKAPTAKAAVSAKKPRVRSTSRERSDTAPTTPPRRAANAPPIEKVRVVVPTEIYEEQKEAFKAPFKAHALKWNYLGTGKGLYKRADGGVHCFTQFKDDGVHYSIWGDDHSAVENVLATWRSLLGESAWARATASGESAVASEAAQKETEATRLWRMQEPQRRPGEPDLFFEKRMGEWRAKEPGGTE